MTTNHILSVLKFLIILIFIVMSESCLFLYLNNNFSNSFTLFAANLEWIHLCRYNGEEMIWSAKWLPWVAKMIQHSLNFVVRCVHRDTWGVWHFSCKQYKWREGFKLHIYRWNYWKQCISLKLSKTKTPWHHTSMLKLYWTPNSIINGKGQHLTLNYYFSKLNSSSDCHGKKFKLSNTKCWNKS